jgi:hypothetical protein
MDELKKVGNFIAQNPMLLTVNFSGFTLYCGYVTYVGYVETAENPQSQSPICRTISGKNEICAPHLRQASFNAGPLKPQEHST